LSTDHKSCELHEIQVVSFMKHFCRYPIELFSDDPISTIECTPLIFIKLIDKLKGLCYLRHVYSIVTQLYSSQDICSVKDKRNQYLSYSYNRDIRINRSYF
jgi:hypothetical protein